jgi:cytochrome P450
MTAPAFDVSGPACSGLPPGPTAPAVIQALRFFRRPIETLEECARQYGPCFTYRLLVGPPLVMVTDPEANRQILTASQDEASAAEANGLLSPILGPNSLLVLDGARHLRERRLLLPPFHGERMQAYARLIQEITDRSIDTWPIDRPFPVHGVMQAITLEVIMRAVFGFAEGTQLIRLRAVLERYMALANSRFAALLIMPAFQIDLGPFNPWGRSRRLRRAIEAVLQTEMDRRRREGTQGRDDILSMLIDARDEQGRPMSDAELHDEMFTLLMAGHETTASALAWVLACILDRPDVLAKLRAELARVVGDGPLEAVHVQKLEYLDAVIKETARLHPVVLMVGRVLRVPMRIGSWELPAGVGVSPCIYLTHRRPDLWPDPARFEPERFIGLRPSPYAFFPFGGGDRRCIGAAFAAYEMKIVLARVLARVALVTTPGYRAQPVQRTVTVSPSDGVPVMRCRVPAGSAFSP